MPPEATPPQHAPRGAIYDIGYQRYEGPRLGRAYAIWSLYVASVRNAFGIGRGAWTKVFVFGLVVVAFLPAVVQVGVAALAPGEFELIAAEEYYEYVQVLLVLFVALVGTDLVGSDKRHRVLPLYFSRPLVRDDYALVKIAALASALLALTLAPQALLFIGNWSGATDGSQYLRDNISDVVPIVGSGVLICLMLSTIAIAIAAYAERRAFAMPATLGFFLITGIVGGILSEIESDLAPIAIILSPFDAARGFTLFLFDALPDLPPSVAQQNSDVVAMADLPGVAYIAIALGYILLASAITVRHYRRLR